MGSKSLIEVGGDTYVTLIWNCKTLDEIDVLHKAVPLRRVQRGASGDSLRESLRPAGKPAEALAKAGGGHPIQPSLVPLLRFAIQGVALAA
jgi:hypothetical protein